MFKNRAKSRAKDWLVLIKSNNKIQNSVSIQLPYQECIKAITEVLCISQKLALVLWDHLVAGWNPVAPDSNNPSYRLLAQPVFSLFKFCLQWLRKIADKLQTNITLFVTTNLAELSKKIRYSWKLLLYYPFAAFWEHLVDLFYPMAWKR